MSPPLVKRSGDRQFHGKAVVVLELRVSPSSASLLLPRKPDQRAWLMQKEPQGVRVDLGVGDAVVFAGNQSRMPEIYQLSDVVVNASLKMGNVGRTVVEALAMNTPVLATTFEGLENLVTDSLNGFIIANQDPAGLCGRIRQLHREPITQTNPRCAAIHERRSLASRHLSI